MIHHIIIGALLSINGRPDGQSRFKEIVENQKMYDFYFYSVALVVSFPDLLCFCVAICNKIDRKPLINCWLIQFSGS